MGEPAFSNHGVWRPLMEEVDGAGDLYWLRWHGRDCRRRRHRSHGIVVVRRSKIQPSNLVAGTTRVAALCPHWWSPTKREMRMSVLPWRWLWRLFECNPCPFHASRGFSAGRWPAESEPVADPWWADDRPMVSRWPTDGESMADRWWVDGRPVVSRWPAEGDPMVESDGEPAQSLQAQTRFARLITVASNHSYKVSHLSPNWDFNRHRIVRNNYYYHAVRRNNSRTASEVRQPVLQPYNNTRVFIYLIKW